MWLWLWLWLSARSVFSARSKFLLSFDGEDDVPPPPDRCCTPSTGRTKRTNRARCEIAVPFAMRPACSVLRVRHLSRLRDGPHASPVHTRPHRGTRHKCRHGTENWWGCFFFVKLEHCLLSCTCRCQEYSTRYYFCDVGRDQTFFHCAQIPAQKLEKRGMVHSAL